MKVFKEIAMTCDARTKNQIRSQIMRLSIGSSLSTCSNLLTRLWRYLTDSDYRFRKNDVRGLYKRMPDEKYLKKKFKVLVGYELNLDEPRTYNEKLQWLKLHDRNPLYTKLVDKYAVKEYVAEIIGNQYIIPTLGVWNSFDEIDFDTLPDQFVLKCTHDSGGLVICTDKRTFNAGRARKKINSSLKQNYYYIHREWPYKNVKPRIIAEKYMQDKSTDELRDYKFFCFNGVPKALFIATDRQDSSTDTKFDFYDMDFKHLDITNGHPNAKKTIQKPVSFEEMKSLAKRLSLGIPHVRVDFYEVDGKVYFGELTFAHWSGLVPFEPIKWDYTFGEWLKLPNK